MEASPVTAQAPPVPQPAAPAARKRFKLALPKGPKLQLLNLSILFAVIHIPFAVKVAGFTLLPHIDYPNPTTYVLACVALAAALDGVLSRWRFGEWRVPWPSMVASLGISMLIDGNGRYGIWPWLALPVLMVGSKHLIRWRGRHLFNPNNFAATVLILLVWARVGVNDWGAAPQTVFLMLLFGTVATTRVKRFDLAVAYLAISWLVYFAIAWMHHWSYATVWSFAFMPVNVMIAFFAITDPATSPEGRAEKIAWATLIVLLGVPATLAGRPEAAVFALFLAAPQRVLVTYLVKGKWPSAPKAPGAPVAAAPAPAAPASGGGSQ